MKKLGKHLGKMIALIVSAVMIICQMDIPVLADSEDCYEIYEWSDVYSRYCKNHYSLEYITNKCDVLSADYTWEEYNNSNTWYLAKGSIIVAGRVIVNGNVNLLLYDNCVLNMPYGIYVPEGSSLTIYNQYVAGVSSENKTYGILNTGFGNGIKECESSDAGIGGGYSNITGSPNPNCGNVTIHGGTINVKGGRYAAGIGGGRGGNGGTVTIYDGTVNVEKGNYAVGIGGGNGYDGYDGSTGGNGGAGNGITVNGGTVTVKCGNDSTGIGGGQGGSASDTGGNGGAGDNISVNGGTVTVECGQNSTGIGGGQGGNGYTGGNGGTGNNISVNGGTVTVKCGDKSTGIGGGNGCNGYTGGNGGAGNGITVKGGTVTVECGGLSTGIGGGKGGFGNSNSGSDGSGNVELGWTDISDSISATNYTGDVKLASVKDFWYKSGGAYEGVEINNNRKVTSDIAGKTLYPINTYAITTTQPTGGTLTANKRSVSGNSITVTGVPTDNSNELGTLTVTKAGSGTVTASGSGNTRTFVMPADDVTVTGTFGAPAEVPVISTQPSNIELTEGYTTGNVLTVAATCVDGHTLSYQWYSNTTNSNTGGTIISGATEASYTIPAGGTAGTAYYYCEVTSTRTEGGTFKTVASNAAKVQITAAAPHTHTYTDSIKTPASCTEPGEMMHRCTGCDYFYTSVIPALGHDFSVEGRVIKQPTLLTEGEKELKCSRCNATKTVTIPKLQPESQEEAEAINEIIEALTDENGNLKVEINATTVENEDGTTVTTVTIDGQEVIKIITDEDGDETVESNIWTIEEEDDDLKYTGAAITPGIHVFDGIHKLSEGSEYAVKYGNNVNASEKAWIYVSFGGSYKGTPAKTVYFTIKPADLQKDVSAENLVVASSKKLQAPIPTITLSNGTVINKQLAYRYLDSEGNVVKGVNDPGSYTLEAKAGKNNNNFVNTLSANITVTGEKVTPLSQARVLFSQKQYTYTGKPVTPGYTLYMGKEKLTENTDFTVKSVTNNTKPGKARITFAAVDGNEKGLVGTKSVEFVIAAGRVLKPQGEGSDFTYTIAPSTPYAKGGAKPFVTVKDGDYTLVYNKDYTVGYDKNSKKITDKATAVVKGMGNYKGSVPVTFEVVKQDIAALSANIIVDDKAESKRGYENPVVTVTDLDGNRLKAGADFNVSDYSAPDENGIVKATLNGKGCYEGSVPISYRYIQVTQHLAKIKAVAIPNKTYTGSRIKLTKKELNKLFYTVDKKAKKINYLEYGKDFEVVGYTNNTKAGVATVTLRGLDNYGGVRILAFKITSAKKSIIDIILKR